MQLRLQAELTYKKQQAFKHQQIRNISQQSSQLVMIVKCFPIWVITAAISAKLFPAVFVSLQTLIVPLLMLVMLGMGLTLKPKDFIELRQYKAAFATGILLQFSVMPIMALLIARLCQLDTELTAGLVLVGSVAGGTASNVMTLVAKGNVALSVSMTAMSTLASVAMTPLLMVWLLGSEVAVPALDILISLFKIILLPVALGVFISIFWDRGVKRIEAALPAISVLVIVLIIAIVVALNAQRFNDIAAWVFLATLLHNLSGLFLGYVAAYLLGFNKLVCRTIAIEVGMQNSGLATALALKFFGVGAALPGAIFSIWLNITGSLFASACVRIDHWQTTKPHITQK
jgi:BASS family bile acid:Na+ symporter